MLKHCFDNQGTSVWEGGGGIKMTQQSDLLDIIKPGQWATIFFPIYWNKKYVILQENFVLNW